MFGRREYRGRGMYDAAMGHPAHGGLSIWQRRMVAHWRSDVEDQHGDASDTDHAAKHGMRQLRSPDDIDNATRGADIRRDGRRDVRARPRDIWEEQDRFRSRRSTDRDRAGNPLA